MFGPESSPLIGSASVSPADTLNRGSEATPPETRISRHDTPCGTPAIVTIAALEAETLSDEALLPQPTARLVRRGETASSPALRRVLICRLTFRDPHSAAGLEGSCLPKGARSKRRTTRELLEVRGIAREARGDLSTAG